ncbi:TPA: AAA domain-containing protein [Citrobacter freundii]|nr:AAA domain-containing protein [Citrobacter freundii]
MENLTALLCRLNISCVRAMEGAEWLCQTHAHAEITPEHLLLKVLEQGDADLTVLTQRYEWDIDKIRRELLNWLDYLPRSACSRPGLSDRLQSLLKQSWMVASLQGEMQIRSLHLLTALTDDPNLLCCDELWPLLMPGKQQLKHLHQLLDLKSDGWADNWQNEPKTGVHVGKVEFVGRPIGAVTKDSEHSSAQLDVLDMFTVDVTAKAREGKIVPVFGRDNEIRQICEILSKCRRNNPILVGEPGVGKTTLVAGFALRITEGNVPDRLKSFSVRTLDTGLLQERTSGKGEYEQRLQNIINAVQQSEKPVLLFIDEAHSIFGTANLSGGAAYAASLLKAALARGKLRIIAVTTWHEYRQHFECDAVLGRHFQMLKVNEPDDETACQMLRGLKSRYAEHHSVHITEDAVRAAVKLSRRYLQGCQLPDKAVNLLDTAAARVRTSLDMSPEAITRLRVRQAALELEELALQEDVDAGIIDAEERRAAVIAEHEHLGTELNGLESRFMQEKNLVTQLITCRHTISLPGEMTALQIQLHHIQQGQPLFLTDVDTRRVTEVIASWTGVPVSHLLKDEKTELQHLAQHLSQRVVGQPAALNTIVRRLCVARTGLACDNGPQGVFLLAGPDGTGRTETALALADVLYGSEKSLITINLAEYHEPNTVYRLKGSAPSNMRGGQRGILTDAVRERPYSVILFDEVEKAHQDVIDLLFQLFERGFVFDEQEREIDFRNTIILMKSSLGSDQLMQLLQDNPGYAERDLQDVLRPILRDHFKPANLAHLQTIIYRPLTMDAMRAIAHIKLEKVTRRLRSHYGIHTDITESVYDKLVDACFLQETGACNIDSLLNQQLLPALSSQLLEYITAGVNPARLKLSWNNNEDIVMEFDTKGEQV